MKTQIARGLLHVSITAMIELVTQLRESVFRDEPKRDIFSTRKILFENNHSQNISLQSFLRTFRGVPLYTLVSSCGQKRKPTFFPGRKKRRILGRKSKFKFSRDLIDIVHIFVVHVADTTRVLYALGGLN